MSRRILIVVLSIVIAVLVVVLVSGIAWNGTGLRTPAGWRRTDSMAASYEFPAAEVDRLELNLSLDDVELTAGKADVIRFEQWTDGGLPDQRKLLCRLDDHVLTGHTDGTAWQNWRFPGPPLSQIKIELPADLVLPVRAALDAGDIEVRELHLGDLALEAELGSISVARVRGADAKIRSSAGDIDILDCSFTQLDCTADLGSIDAAKAAVQTEVNLRSSSGDQRFQGSCTRFDGSTSAGSVAAEISGAVSASGSSSAGSVEILCRDVHKLENVNASADLGDVTVGLPSGSKISLGYDRGLGGLEFDGDAGLEIDPDGIRVDIRTSAGDLLLRAV